MKSASKELSIHALGKFMASRSVKTKGRRNLTGVNTQKSKFALINDDWNRLKRISNHLRRQDLLFSAGQVGTSIFHLALDILETSLEHSQKRMHLPVVTSEKWHNSMTGFILEWVQANNRNARDMLFSKMGLHEMLRQYAHAVLPRTAHRIGHTDLLHNALVKLEARIEMDRSILDFANRMKFQAYLGTIMRRELYEHIRRQRQNRETLEGNIDQLRDIINDQSDFGDPILWTNIDETLQAQPERTRKIWELRYVDKLTIEETAELANVSKATVNRHCSMVRKALCLKLKDDSAEV